MKDDADKQTIQTTPFFLTSRANQSIIIQLKTKAELDGIYLRVSLFATWGKNFILVTKTQSVLLDDAWWRKMDFQRTFALSGVLLGFLYRIYASPSVSTNLSQILGTEFITSWLAMWIAATTTSDWGTDFDKIKHQVSR